MSYGDSGESSFPPITQNLAPSSDTLVPEEHECDPRLALSLPTWGEDPERSGPTSGVFKPGILLAGSPSIQSAEILSDSPMDDYPVSTYAPDHYTNFQASTPIEISADTINPNIQFSLKIGQALKKLTPGQSLIIGRDSSCNIVVHDPFVSAQHLEIERTIFGYRFRDLDSTNGTFYNSWTDPKGVFASQLSGKPKLLDFDFHVRLGGFGGPVLTVPEI